MAFKSRIGKFTKLGRSSRSPLMLAAFVVLFAGIGAYLIHNSYAATGMISVRLIAYGSGSPVGGVHLIVKPLNSGSICNLNQTTDYNKNTGSDGWAAFGPCDTNSNYQVDIATGSGWVYNFSGPAVFSIGATANTHTYTVLVDTDRDGIADSSDPCPNSATYSNPPVCGPVSPTPVNASVVSALSGSPNPVSSGGVSTLGWNIANGTGCTLSAWYNDTPSNVTTVSVSNSGTRSTIALTKPASYRISCNGTNGGAGASSSTTVNIASSGGITCNGGTVTGNTCTCPQYFTLKDNTCTRTSCPSGQNLINGSCITTCQPGYDLVNGQCIKSQINCSVGYTLINGNCVKVTPPTSGSTSSRTVARTGGTASTGSDKEKPSVPSNFRAEQFGAGEVDLSWDASTDNVGVAGYTLERSSDQSDWTMLDDAITDTSYSDMTADYNVTYSYRLSAKDASGNFSDYAVVDITTNDFSANVKADEESTITSDDGIVEVTFPAGALSEDAFCEITKDSVSKNPKGYKLAAGGYTINCRNKAGDTIDSIDKELKVVMHLKAYTKKYSKFTAYAVGDSLSAIPSTFNSKTGDLSFNLSELQTFAAFGSKKGSSWWIWLLLVLLIVGVAFLIRRLRGGSGSDDYYDTTDYVSMPPSAPVSPLDTGAGGYQHHPSLPELVAQGGQPQPQAGQFPGAAPQQPGPGQQPPYPPQQPPLPPQ